MSQVYDNIAANDLISSSRTVILNRDEASATWFLGAGEPASLSAGRPWIDTGNTLIKVRNATNTGWITIGTYATGLGHLLLAGGTMTGDILLANDPTNVLHPSTKQYTDARAVANKGKRWITGDDVITFGTSHADNNYRWVATLVSSPMGGVTTRNNKHTYPMPIYLKNEDADRGLVRINGGFGFTSCGDTGAISGVTERFDDITNTQTARAAATVRSLIAGYSLNGFGFSSCGNDGAVTDEVERFDDTINGHTPRALATARHGLAGYSMAGKGFTSCGQDGIGITGVTQRFDDTINGHTARTAATARRYLTGYSFNNYGFTSCGFIAADTGVTERFDDDVNTHTGRLAATARDGVAGYSMKGKGFTSCGHIAAVTGITQRFDDTINGHTARLAATARQVVSGYSLNGFGFTSGGNTGAVSAVTQRFDDTANAHTARTALNTARDSLAAYATNAYFINYVSYND